MNSRLMEIERLCNLILANLDHPSRSERLEKYIAEMHEVTAPPTLGVSVSDGIRSEDRPG